MEQNMDITKKNYNDEIDLLDLLKIIIRNKKIIFFSWLLIVFVATIAGVYYKGHAPKEAERKFQIKEISEDLGQINPISFYDNQDFIDRFFQDKKILELSKGLKMESALDKRNFVKSLFSLSGSNNDYSLKLKGKDSKSLEELENIYFENLNGYISSVYGEIIKSDLDIAKGQADKNKVELTKLEEKIKVLVRDSKNNANSMELKDMYPSIFAEKDAISLLYSDNYKVQKTLEGNLLQLNHAIRMKSSLNEVQSKLSLKLIFIISNLLGVFLGVFLVFVKEFIKSINWKELKES